MGSVNISIRDEAYKFLKTLKGNDRSFSDVILEMSNKESDKGTGKGILKFAGILKKVNWNEREKRMKEFRKNFNKHIGETVKYMHLEK